METEKRREVLITRLRDAAAPVTGTDLAQQFGVSRQVIVQDIAILRAAGEQVLATPQGYMIPRGLYRRSETAVVACRHTREQIEDEIGIVVDLGGKVLDVIVEHPVYGEMRGNLMIASRRDLTQFLGQLGQTEARPLSALTDGVHLHTIEAPDRRVIEEIIAALGQAGYLVD
ncbi:MAG: transcription repressor NadR [Bacillota bacterium]|nr:transcription repressor NadR [Bacillota bacterium]MDW7683405.1 transcription repressor NadR [Bacillota bacterium]